MRRKTNSRIGFSKVNNIKLLIDRDNGAENMKRDISLFNSYETEHTSSILRIYSWSKPCITLGYSQNIEEEIDENMARAMGWDIAKRPTGGGIVFHNTNEVTYSFVTGISNPILPNGLLKSYIKISEAIVCALQSIGIDAKISGSTAVSSKPLANLCFSYPAEYEVVVGNRKIVGSAQKRSKTTILQQGSIFVSKPDEAVFSLLKKPYEAHNAVSVEEALGRIVSFDELSTAIIGGFRNVL